MHVRPSMLSLVGLLLAAACDQAFVPEITQPAGPGASVTITVSAASPTLSIGDSTQVSAVVKDMTGQVMTGSAVTFASSAPAVVRVDTKGIVKAMGAGVATVTATSAGQSATTPITVLGATTPPGTSTGELNIPLSVQRFDGGAGAVLVSNAIPLPRGALFPSATKNLRLLIVGVEKPLYVEALQGLYPDGSLRSVLVQFNETISSGETLVGELVIGSPRTTTDIAKPTAPRGVPLAAALPVDPNYLISTGLVGPTISKDSIAPLGADFTRYDADFAQWADYHWSATGDAWNDGYYYDAAMVYYAAWVRTGNPKYWYRGSRMAVSYRNGYLVPANYAPPAHWSFVEGLSMHYWLTGDDASRDAVGKLANYAWYGQLRASVRDNVPMDTEGRIAGRVLQAVLFAHLLDVADRGVPIQRGVDMGDPPAWADLLKAAVDYILPMQQPDGAIRPLDYCRQSANFSTGILDDVLIEYYMYFTPDPRIPGWMRKSADFLKTQWDPQAKAFRYISGPCAAAASDPTGLAGDLNGLLVNTFAWTYNTSRVAEYHDLADQIFSGVVSNGYPAGSKQFNQEFTSSYRYFAFRR